MKNRKKYSNPKIRIKRYERYSDSLRQMILKRSVPLETVFGDSIITVVGHSELWVENYKALLLYENERILIQSKTHKINVEGTNLTIRHYMEEHMMIQGNISKITYSK